MTPSNNLLNALKGFEKLELKAYKDIAGIPTIGYGCTLYTNGKPVKMGDVISLQKAEELFAWEVGQKAAAANQYLMNTKVSQSQFDALVSFAFNVGTEALRTSTLIKKVRNNPNDQTTLAISDVADVAVKVWMKKKGIEHINIIHYCFMVWCKITDPKTGNKVPAEGLLNRRNSEYKLYSAK